ncbi:MAG: Mrp/NBP35 family ATP-binding protein [Acidobacteriota bacterium]
MATEQQILETLNRFTAPGSTAGLVDGGAVRNIEVDGTSILVALAVPAGHPGPIDELRTGLTQALNSLDGIDSAEIQIQTMLSTIPTAPPQVQAPEPPSWGEKISGIKNVIAVASGKGGVGKSTVSANLALALAQADFAVGLLDADIYGPSQQMMTGAKGEPRGTADGRIHPIMAPGGVSVMSLGFIVDTDQPVIWRGPLLMKALEQLIVDVEWGDLDYLIVDLPPGTGDITLSLCQNVDLAGAIIVTTPQDVALIDARKGLAMFQKLDVEVLGLIENMSGFTCPECGHEEHIFGSGGGRKTAETLKIPFLGGIPLDPSIVVGGDAGRPVVSDRPDSAAAKAFHEVAKTIAAG